MPMRCEVCADGGMIELTSGTWTVGDARRPAEVEASPDRPVYRVCRGLHGLGCPYREWRQTPSKQAAGR